MISTVDGRATLGGRSGSIGDRADRELFHELRACADAVMVGAGTARAEHYGRLIGSAERRRRRVEAGLTEEPLACVVSASLDLSAATIPLLAQPDAEVMILTPSQEILPKEGLAAKVGYLRNTDHDGAFDVGAAISALFRRYGVGTLVCEGGPHLNAQLLAAGVVDELLLCLGPKLAGGESLEAGVRIVMGPELEPPSDLDLLSAHESESYLFLRYGVRSARG
jgi:riboflavin biosynthesis pyrimidine reductase